MSGAQKIILSFFILAALLIGAFPPWRYVYRDINRSVGFHFLFDPPGVVNREYDIYREATIATSQLTVEWVTLVLVSGALLFLFKGVKGVSLKGVRPFLSRIRYRINHPFHSRE